jgi:adenylate kinase family enzyme
MFGLSGSGKTTFSKRLERFDFQRLSVDEEIWNKFGKFGIDYKKEEYKELQIVANRELYIRFLELLKCNQNIVVDFSFWQKENRGNYKQIVEDNTGKWFLV